ncbi:MAG: DUF177 domain-containing protein [Oscillospiraceae bacterium]|nr:DUF177 domain-containing protein [Oscillospiraceae bacterium]
MKLDITRGVQTKGIDVPFTLEETWGEDRWGGDTVRYVSPVRLSGTYMITGETVVIDAQAQTVVESRCARCLAPALTEVSAPVSEAFVREAEGEAPAEEQYTYQGHVLDLTDAVRTSVLLEVPTRILCREDCKGLCDQCGANLNVTTCSCRKETVRRNPFQALAERMEEISPMGDQEV